MAAKRYFEDFRAGDVIELGQHTFTQASIIDFARQFDPQPFHIDPVAAPHTAFGGLVASGWHTASIYMRLLVDGLLKNAASQGSPGVETLQWLKPVRPGDTLRARVRVIETIPSKSRPDRGTLKTEGEMVDKEGEVVMRMTGIGFYGRRPPP
ncbi:MAG TPA: MaoC family dehydratase [Stellaceae bacterium]|nr:MaoC family dehydratase [Stellaceae bacterium]